MQLETVINEQGILTAKLPKSLWDKKVVVSVQVVPEKQAETILDIFAEADKLDSPRRTHEEILEDLHALRASK